LGDAAATGKCVRLPFSAGLSWGLTVVGSTGSEKEVEVEIEVEGHAVLSMAYGKQASDIAEHSIAEHAGRRSK